jgi:hypothetical protein
MSRLIPKCLAHPLTRAAVALCAVPALSSCVTVSPPDKPIEINLNVDIKQEVLVRLQRDVETLINQNPEAFPEQPADGSKPQ